jgi:hypothetical protein
MTDREQLDSFGNDVDALVERYRHEYDMSYAVVVGVLVMKAHLLCDEVAELGGDDAESI